MNPSMLEVLRETTAFLRAWLDETQRSRDFSLSDSRSLRQIAGRLRAGDVILKDLPPKAARDEELQKAVTNYEDVLGELRASIAKLEITLKIRQSQMARQGASLSAIRGWADLAARIG